MHLSFQLFLYVLIFTFVCVCVCVCVLQENINVDEAARSLVEHILQNDKGLPYEESNGDRVRLEQDPATAESKSGCC